MERNMDMKRIYLLLGVFALCLGAYAQDLKSLFVAMPDSLSPLLTEVNRADFGDFLDSKMKAEVKNRFGKSSEMTRLTSDYLFLKLTGASTVEMKLLPLNDSVKIVCVVSTYMGPVPDSKVTFYDTDWKMLPANDFLTIPGEDRFYRAPVSDIEADSLKNLRLRADMYLLKAELSADDNTLSFIYTTPEYMDKQSAAELRKYLWGKPLKYQWKDGRYIPE